MQIKSLLDKASKAYYDGSPFMSDTVFDALASKHSYNEVGSTPTSDKVKHKFPMYSLQKVYVGEKNTVEEKFQNKTTVNTPKLDGAAISLLYEDGFLIQAATRGDGVEGVDITEKAYVLDSIPNYIDTEGYTQVTGEIVAPKTIDNARNYAAGALNTKGTEDFKAKDITFIAYGVQPYISSTYTEDMLKLIWFNFNTITGDSWESIYPTDGKVVRLNSNDEFTKLGYTGKFPRAAYALKDRADVEIKETILREVLWQIGKTGRVTPVAIFDEVVIEDAKITRATLNNIAFIEEMDLYIGDTILVSRAGAIIPQIIGKI